MVHGARRADMLAMMGVVLLSVLCSATAAPAAAKITSLPGYAEPIAFDQYSGYITVDESAGRNFFYWLVESQGTPSKDPLVLWLTGGPGCSSLFALLTEHGPFSVDPDNCSQLRSNPFSWNKVANVIYLESPGGVGFSYTLDDPEFNSHDFYVAGGGHYVPQLSQLIAEHPTMSKNFKGFAVGNPSFNFKVDGSHYWEFMYTHALFGSQEYSSALKACGGTIIGNRDPACVQAADELRANLVGITPYDIYAPCIGAPSTNGACLTYDMADAFLAHGDVAREVGSQTFVPCINLTAARTYLRLPEVQAALHVSSHSMQWRVCSLVVNYTYYAPTMAPVYLNLSASNDILVFSGDVDSCVPYPGTEENMDLLGYPISKKWYQWLYDDQIAGYVKTYDVGSGGTLRYATVKGAGHMVATYKPKQALALFTSYIRGEPLGSVQHDEL